MKKTVLLLLSLCVLNSLSAQWNYSSGTSGPIYYSGGYVGVNTNSPGFPLHVNGTIYGASGIIIDNPTANAIGAWIRGGANIGGNLVVQGGLATNAAWPAWWITGESGYMMIGTNGGTQPTSTASPIDIDVSGHVGINTLNTSGYTFNVNGTAVFDGVTVKSFSSTNPKSTPWADYVFGNHYQLPSLQSLAEYIRANRHLPGIPTTAEVQNNGLDLGANQAKLLEKIEQLTLYAIDQKDQTDSLKTENKKLRQRMTAQDQRLTILEEQINSLKAMIK